MWTEHPWRGRGCPSRGMGHRGRGPSRASRVAAWARASSKSGWMTAFSCGFQSLDACVAESHQLARLRSPRGRVSAWCGGVEECEIRRPFSLDTPRVMAESAGGVASSGPDFGLAAISSAGSDCVPVFFGRAARAPADLLEVQLGRMRTFSPAGERCGGPRRQRASIINLERARIEEVENPPPGPESVTRPSRDGSLRGRDGPGDA